MDEPVKMYTCPFCKQEIVDNIDSLIEHRKDGGDCERAFLKAIEKKPIKFPERTAYGRAQVPTDEEVRRER